MSAIIDKVRKLLALSKSTNAHEAAAAAGAAARLIEEHGIASAEIAMAGNAPVEGLTDPESLYSYRRDTAWRSRLASALARHHGCKAILLGSQHSPQGKRYTVLGRKSDVEALHYMFAYLSTEVARLTAESEARGKIGKQSFALGCAEGIIEQLSRTHKEVVQKAQAAGQSTALVFIDSDRERVAVKYKELYPQTRKTRGPSGGRIDDESRAAGREAGRNVHMGKSIGGGSSRLLGGG